MPAYITVLILQGLLGGFDSLAIHEIRERLPSRPKAVTELRLHALREVLYACVFIGLAWWQWHGSLAWVLAGVLLIEVAITAWDFVEEDRSRRLSATERVTHLLLSIGYGVVLALLIPELWTWSAQPTGLVGVDYGWASWVLSLYGLGVSAWAVRNLIAAHKLSHPLINV